MKNAGANQTSSWQSQNMPYSVLRPDPLSEKTLRLEAAGESGENEVMLVVPTIIRPEEPVTVNLAVLDEKGMPVVNGAAPVTIYFPDASGGVLEQTVAFSDGRPAVCRIADVVFYQAGLTRLEASFEGKSVYSNPALVTAKDRPAILWGDPHIHTVLSDCHPDKCRSRVLTYSAARYAYGLDFAAVADHVSGGKRGSFGKWRDNVAMCELFDEPDAFSTLWAYETSMNSGKGGDNNVYPAEKPDNYVDPGPDGLNVNEMSDQLCDGDLVVPHHTSRAKKHGEIPPEIFPGEKRMPVMEIYSKWGRSEYYGNPNALELPHDGPAYAQDFLAKGYRFGFVGGTDTHTSLTYCKPLEPEHIRKHPGLTAVFAPANKRDAIHNAISNRQCYAASGERIFLDVDCQGLGMGEIQKVTDAEASRRICVSCAAKTRITSVEIIRNGEVVHSVTPEDWKTTFEWSDTASLAEVAITDAVTNTTPFVYYYIRVTAESGAYAWSSPCWLELERGW